MAEAQVEAGRLELLGLDRLDREDLARADELAQRLVGQDARVVLGGGFLGGEELGGG